MAMSKDGSLGSPLGIIAVCTCAAGGAAGSRTRCRQLGNWHRRRPLERAPLLPVKLAGVYLASLQHPVRRDKATDLLSNHAADCL